MPWKVKKSGSEYCVFDKDGKKMKCYATKKEAEKYQGALYANAGEKLENLENELVENGPVLLGAAVTNIPHLPLPPMSVVEVNGEKQVRVPLLRAGIFRHPNGKLVFNENVFNKMLSNYDEGKSHYGVSLNIKHKPELGALAWFDKDKGGKIVQEDDPKFGKLLVGYGKPTCEQTLELINNKQYAYASAEFQPHHVDTMITRLSMDDMDEIELEELVEDNQMDEVTISAEELRQLKEKAEKVEKLETDLKDATDKILALEEAAKPVVKLEDSIPENIKVMLEDQAKEINRLKKNALATQIDLVITKAQSYRDANGYGHAPVLLEIAKNAMLGESVTAGETEVIKLESGNPADIADYFRKVFIYMLENIPGQVRLEPKAEPEDKPLDLGGVKFTESDYKSFWVENV